MVVLREMNAFFYLLSLAILSSFPRWGHTWENPPFYEAWEIPELSPSSLNSVPESPTSETWHVRKNDTPACLVDSAPAWWPRPETDQELDMRSWELAREWPLAKFKMRNHRVTKPPRADITERLNGACLFLVSTCSELLALVLPSPLLHLCCCGFRHRAVHDALPLASG